MESEKKDLFKKEVEKEQSKKPYSTPQLTVHGTVEEITSGGGLVITDGPLLGSIL